MLKENPTAAHHLIAKFASLIHCMIIKHPQNGSLKGIFNMLLAVAKRENLWWCILGCGRGAEFTNCSCPCPQHRICFTILQQKPNRGLLKMPTPGFVQAKSATGLHWRKWVLLRWRWEKIQGGFPLHEMYILDTQKEADPRNTNRFLLSPGKLGTVTCPNFHPFRTVAHNQVTKIRADTVAKTWPLIVLVNRKL